MPGLIVGHGSVGDALEQMAGHAHPMAKLRQQRRQRLASVRREQQVERIDLLPHLARYGVPDGPGVLAGSQHAGADGVGVFRVERQEADHVLLRRSAVTLEKGGAVAGDVYDGLPLVAIAARQVEHQVLVHADEAGHVLCALGVAPHPVDRVGDAAEEGFWSRGRHCCCCPSWSAGALA